MRNTASRRYSKRGVFLAVFVAWGIQLAVVRADEPVTLDTVKPPQPNRMDEPLATEFSLDQAVNFLDSAALNWQKQFNCMTCHTNYAFLLVRPVISSDAPAHKAVREYAEKLVTERWPTKGPRWDAEVVMTGAILASNDSATTGKLHAVTREALDRMWTVQREDGGFSWLKCEWPPMEYDDYFGATMCALGTGIAPEDYAKTDKAQEGIKKLKAYFAANPAPSLHHRAMLVWASTYLPELLSSGDQKECVDKMLSMQHSDGGWGLAQLGDDWVRKDRSAQDLDTSDGYGTGFVIYIARRVGVPADDPRLAQGIAWLKSHQRESGRWFTRSVYADNKHFISHAGTAFAILAMSACDALPKPATTAAAGR